MKQFDLANSQLSTDLSSPQKRKDDLAGVSH